MTAGEVIWCNEAGCSATETFTYSNGGNPSVAWGGSGSIINITGIWIYNATEEGGGGGDTTPPNIQNVTAVNITTTASNITWDTNEGSNSTVNYGTTVSLGNSAGQDDNVTSHTVSLTSLSEATLYYYNVTSCDDAGNCNSTGRFNFTTLDVTPPVISNIQVTGLSNETATITWTTNENSNTSVNYGTTTSLGTKSQTNDAVTSHSRSLSSLTPNTTYYYNVTSCDTSGNCQTNGTYNFTTNITTTETAVITNSLNFYLNGQNDTYNFYINGSIRFSIDGS
jgi:hypothetical protein